jgi:hypothetical protein
MTLVTRLVTTLMATLLVVGMATLTTAPARASETATVEMGTGSTAMPDQVLRKGCRTYAYDYSVTTTTGDWVLETFLVDPDGNSVSSGVFSSDSEPDAGSSAFGVCRSATRFGRFTIQGKLTTYDGWDEAVASITPTYVRLHRWRRR